MAAATAPASAASPPPDPAAACTAAWQACRPPCSCGTRVETAPGAITVGTMAARQHAFLDWAHWGSTKHIKVWEARLVEPRRSRSTKVTHTWRNDDDGGDEQAARACEGESGALVQQEEGSGIGKLSPPRSRSTKVVHSVNDAEDAGSRLQIANGNRGTSLWGCRPGHHTAAAPGTQQAQLTTCAPPKGPQHASPPASTAAPPGAAPWPAGRPGPPATAPPPSMHATVAASTSASSLSSALSSAACSEASRPAQWSAGTGGAPPRSNPTPAAATAATAAGTPAACDGSGGAAVMGMGLGTPSPGTMALRRSGLAPGRRPQRSLSVTASVAASESSAWLRRRSA